MNHHNARSVYDVIWFSVLVVFLLTLNRERGLCNLFYFDTIRWMQKQKKYGFINQMKSTLKGLPETVLLFVAVKPTKKTIAVAVNTILNFGFLWHSPYHYSSSTKWGRIFCSLFLLAFSTLSSAASCIVHFIYTQKIKKNHTLW